MVLSNPGARWQDYVNIDPAICHGQPCVQGTRISVSVVLDNVAAGLSTEKLIAEYPNLDPQAIRGVLAYASALTRDELLAFPDSA